jgi:hypothetical protein
VWEHILVDRLREWSEDFIDEFEDMID